MIKTKFDILWMLLSAGLVFFMQAGFLCLESGLTRTKNSINVAIKNITDFGIATIIFFFIGFGFMFGDSAFGLLGMNHYMPGFSLQEPHFPVLFIFQLMFCGTAATIVSGAVAERMKFGAYIIVTIIISSIIYPVFGHWAWGRDLIHWPEPTGWLFKLGFVDFAGSTVVHSTGGWVGLAAISILGSRLGKFTKDSKGINITGHNLPTAMLGTMILWFGWIGFNGGSTFEFSNNIPGIIANTMLSGAAGMVSALIYGWWRLDYAEATLPLNGALAGLVAITAGCHAVSSLQSFFIGIVAGILMFESRILLIKFNLDDAVGAIPVHLTGGIWGTLAVGFFGDPALLGTGLGYIEQILVQLLGIIVCACLGFGVSYGILRLVNRVFALRVDEENEKQGLNYSEHRASTELNDLIIEMEYQRKTGDLTKNVTVEPFTEVGQIANMYNMVLKKIKTGIREKELLTQKLMKNYSHLQSDLLTARKIQSSFFKEEDKEISGLSITTKYMPLSEVGGDFFDITELKPGVIRFFLADTTGHGVKAALLTMGVKAIYDSLKKGAYDLTGVLYFFNNEFLRSFESVNQFLTCILVDIDTNKNTLTYASAGHIPQYLTINDSIYKLEKTGRIIGAVKDTSYRPHSFHITENSSLFLFTDGLTEGWNADEEEFGEERIETFLKDNRSLSMKEKIKRVLNQQEIFLEGNNRQDDLTIIGIEKSLVNNPV